jgi:hypothetical protein
MGKTRNTYKNLVGNSLGKPFLGVEGDEIITLRWILRNYVL